MRFLNLQAVIPALVLFLFVLSVQPGIEVGAVPAPLPNLDRLSIRQPSPAIPPRPKTQGRECNSTSCGYSADSTDTTEVTEGPVIIRIDIVKPENPDYGVGAEVKTRKVNNGGPPKDHRGVEVQCAGETCVNRAVKGYSRVPMVCTHMAGRLWLPRFWTCCPHRTYAAKDGNCCTQLNTTTWECANNARIPVRLYLVGA